MFPVDSWETFLQFFPLASQIWLVRTLLAPLRVTPLWLAWPTLRVWFVPSRCCRRSRPTVTVVSPLWGGAWWVAFFLSAGVAFRLFCASALFSRRVALLASGWGYLPLWGGAGGVFFVGRGLHRLPIFLSPLRGWGKPRKRLFSRFAPLRVGTTKQP